MKGRTNPFFGLNRNLPRKLAPSKDSLVDGVRRWLGYKLYAVVYWLLKGHA